MKELNKLILPIIGRSGALKYIFLGVVSGLSSFLFINQTTIVIGLLIDGKLNTIRREYLLIFATIILIFVWTKRSLSLTSMDISLKISWTLRTRILKKVLNANYYQLSKRITDIQTAILSDIGVLTSASLGIIDFFIAIIVTVSCFTYLATISIQLFIITFFVAVLGVSTYYFSSKANMRNLQKRRELEGDFQTNLNNVLNGFKQLFMDDSKASYLFRNKIVQNAKESFDYSVKAGTGYINNQMTGQILFYILIALVLLVFSIVLNFESKNVVAFIFTLLYLLGSIETIMAQFPNLMKAKIAANKLLGLNDELEKYQKNSNGKSSINLRFGEFEHLEIRGLTFSYHTQEESFKIGPINFALAKGEIIFINGANGSGKTTFIYNLLGLLPPQKGEISLNNNPITPEIHSDFRKYFAVVFSDVYLFNEVLKEDVVEFNLWQYYLTLFEIEKKVTLKKNKLSTTDLSSGQRKRLALVVALIEQKPIIVLDEWAADQDPYFRNKFYTEILPILNSNGFTFIAITHDDRYYHYGAKLFRIEDGLLYKENIEKYTANGSNLFS